MQRGWRGRRRAGRRAVRRAGWPVATGRADVLTSARARARSRLPVRPSGSPAATPTDRPISRCSRPGRTGAGRRARPGGRAARRRSSAGTGGRPGRRRWTIRPHGGLYERLGYREWRHGLRRCAWAGRDATARRSVHSLDVPLAASGRRRRRSAGHWTTWEAWRAADAVRTARCSAAAVPTGHVARCGWADRRCSPAASGVRLPGQHEDLEVGHRSRADLPAAWRRPTAERGYGLVRCGRRPGVCGRLGRRRRA